MKKMTLILSVAAAFVALGTSCQKEQNAPGARALNAGFISVCSDSTATDTLRGVISGTKNLTNDVVYYLDGIVYVTGTLNIEEGTLVRGLAGTPRIDDNNPGTAGGTLVITKSGYIDAEGTASCPIVFTSWRNLANPQSGDWGGIVILGEARHNRANTTVVEGITGTPPADATYGGTNDSDNSGVLKYVRIEYAGWELSTDNELNGLTLAGVGSGTTLSYVEVYKSKDDGIEFFGGTVNGDHLIVVDSQDDMFDFDNGYTGTIDYALGLSDFSRADKSQSNGIEMDGNATGDTTVTPRTFPKLNHFTIIGQPTATAASTVYTSPTATYGRAAHLRRNTLFSIRNSVFLGFNNGVSLDGGGVPPGYTKIWYDTRGISILDNSLSHGYVRAYSTELSNVFSNYTFPLTLNSGYTSGTANAGISLTNPFSRSAFTNFAAATGGDAAFYGAGAVPSGATWGVNVWARVL